MVPNNLSWNCDFSPGLGRFRLFFTHRGALAAAAGFMLLPGLSKTWGEEPGISRPESMASKEMTEGDCKLLLEVLKTLSQDNVLAPLHLGVSVHDQVVTLWGPVPSDTLGHRAGECLRQVQGVAEVIDDLHVVPTTDPSQESLFSELPPAPSNQQRNPTPSGSNQPLVWRSPEQTSPPLTEEKGNKVVVQGNNSREVGHSTMMAMSPGLTSGPATEVVWKTPVVLLAPVPVENSGSILEKSIDAIRQENEHFRGVQAEVVGGIVHLHGTVDHWEDLYVLAKRISQLTEVQRVILEDVRLATPHP